MVAMPQSKADTQVHAAFRIQELLTPEAFPHPVSEISLRETHISWIVLTGSFAYKIKKAVKFDFIDALTLERRRTLCDEELRLNRRLAPELYVDVVAITRSSGRLLVGGDGPAVEYAVRMRQFDASDELPALLARQYVGVAQIEELGEALAQFHLSAAVAPRAQAPEKTQQMYDSVFGNLAQLLAHFQGEHSMGLNRLIDWTHDTAQTLEHAFEARERGGFVRECHGDLHAANIVRLHGRLVPFDRIEFDPRLRWIDVVNDVAFLVMDLTGHDRSDLALALLSRYLEATGDYEGVHLLPFYAAYRALVRAKVDALAAEEVPARAAEFCDRMQRRIRSALSWIAPRQPLLILMHGLSGSGKSWLSGQLVPELRAIRIRSDIERKRLAGMLPTQSAADHHREGIYSPEFSHRTYARLADSAESCLRAGFDVIVDAAFLDATDRELFRALGKRVGVRRIIISCQADPGVLTERITRRSSGLGDPSDATLPVLDQQLREIRPFEPAEQPHVIVVDTGEPDALRRTLAAVRARTGAE
jgi:aminoglycoside phosphotransferase family enzyme/predicted kinase